MSLRGPAFILSNTVGLPASTVAIRRAADAAYVPSALGPEWLKTEEPTEIARITTVHPSITGWSVVFGALRNIGGVALVNSSLSPGGLYRYAFGPDDANAYAKTSIVPTSIVSSSNAAGVVADVDEGTVSPDSTYISPATTDLPWTVRLGFPTPPAVVYRTGANHCYVAAFIALAGTSGPINYYPAVTVTLYQGTTLITVLGTRAVTKTAGQLMVFPFDFALLPTTSGASLRVEFAFTAGQNSVVTPTPYGKLDATDIWLYSTGGSLTHDSGWLTSPSVDFPDDDPAPSTHLPYFPPTELVNVGSMTVSIMDDQLAHAPTVYAGVGVLPGNANEDFYTGVVDAGVLVAGPLLVLGGAAGSPGIALADTPGGGIIVEQIGGATVGGQTYSADAFRRRGLSVQLTVTRDELLTLQDRIAWRRGKAGAFFFSAEPDIPLAKQRFTSSWYTLASMTDPTRLPGTAYDGGDGSMLYVVTLTFEEKL